MYGMDEFDEGLFILLIVTCAQRVGEMKKCVCMFFSSWIEENKFDNRKEKKSQRLKLEQKKEYVVI